MSIHLTECILIGGDLTLAFMYFEVGGYTCLVTSIN